MNSPSKKQTILLNFITEFTERNQYSPSYREIMHAMQLKSVSAVAEHIDNCVAAGYLKKIPKSPRSLEVIRPETFDETIDLFNRKISELSTQNPRDSRIKQLFDAAEILGVEVDQQSKNL